MTPSRIKIHQNGRAFLLKYQLADGVDEKDGDDGEGCQDDQEDLEVFLQLPTEVDGVQAALLETGGAVFMMMVVMMMLFMMLFHIYLRMLTTRAAMEMRMEVAEIQRVVD